MYIDERLFLESERVDFDSLEWMECHYDLLTDLALRELGRHNYDEEDEDLNEQIQEQLSNIISIYRINVSSLLYRALLEWYGSKEKMDETIRSAVYYREYDRTYLYYVTGCGYDIISSDLLGGSADGRAVREFLKFINEV